MTRIWLVVRTQFEGYHRYPDAPLAVEFLRYPHRHMFHVTVKMQQSHVEREVEYILFKRWLNSTIVALQEQRWVAGMFSCEAMAQDVLSRIVDDYGDRNMSVEISEDGENGGIVEIV